MARRVQTTATLLSIQRAAWMATRTWCTSRTTTWWASARMKTTALTCRIRMTTTVWAVPMKREYNNCSIWQANKHQTKQWNGNEFKFNKTRRLKSTDIQNNRKFPHKFFFWFPDIGSFLCVFNLLTVTFIFVFSFLVVSLSLYLFFLHFKSKFEYLFSVLFCFLFACVIVPAFSLKISHIFCNSNFENVWKNKSVFFF